ncbi:hypothetical protein TIFTF001_012893 [Ficus carica]|uniref:Uncharacterized protein n=1 Tax=Ficus carica TaxID=3494 RepID=A0AA88DI58_FICCA|nr:hypothetical protein TIFTF001_012893 [Ficus carica]
MLGNVLGKCPNPNPNPNPFLCLGNAWARARARGMHVRELKRHEGKGGTKKSNGQIRNVHQELHEILRQHQSILELCLS